jgi:TP901 family phage tail tape measure protein
MANKESRLSIVIRAVNQASAEIQRVTKDFRKFGADVGKIGKGMSTAITLPTLAVGAASVAAFAQFEKGMSNVATLIDTSKESLQEMGLQVQAIGQRTPVALEDLTGALYDLRSSGVGAAEQFTVLEQSARLAVAGLGTTKEAADLVTSSMNAFQLSGEEAQQVFDNIFKTTQYGKTTIAQLAQGFGGVAGTVASTGTKLDEYLASVAALTTTGLPASEAHTQLKAVISGLTRETEKSRAVFHALGARDFKDLIAQSGGLVPALQRITDKLGGSEAHILELVGSTEALNAMLGLSGAQAEVFATALDSMRTGADALTGAFEKQNSTLSAQSQRTKNAVQAAGASIGAILAPAVTAFAEAAQKLSNWMLSLDEGTRGWVVGIFLAIAAIGPALIVIGKLTAGVAALKAGLLVLKPLLFAVAAGFKSLAVALFTTPVGWIVLGITALIAVGYLLIRNWDKVKLFLSLMWDVVKDAMSAFMEWASHAVDVLIEYWQPVRAFFIELWDDVVEVFAGAWRRIQEIIDKITGAVSGVIDAASSVASSVGSFFGMDENEESPTGGSGSGRPSLLPPAQSFPRLFAQPTPPPAEARVTVDFANAPRGTRVAQDSGNTADVDLSVGYQMGMLR